MGTGSKTVAGRKKVLKRMRGSREVVDSWNYPKQDWEATPHVTPQVTPHVEPEEDGVVGKQKKSVVIQDAPKDKKTQKNQFGAEYYFADTGEKIFVAGGWRRCPRCGALDTIGIKNYHSISGTDRSYIYHYRRCTRVVCKHSFSALRPN